MQILKEKIRENIIDAAREAFTKEGYEKATLKDIADKADISVGNIYRYFKSKEEILAEIIGNFKESVLSYSIKSKNTFVNATKKEYKLFIELFSKIIVDNYNDFRLTTQNKTNPYILGFRDFILDLSVNSVMESIYETRVDKVVSRAWTIACFEGLSSIIEESTKPDKKTVERIEVYLELVLQDVKKRIERA